MCLCVCVCRPTDPRAHGESSNVKSVLVLAVHYRAFWFWLYITSGEDYTLALVMELANVLLICC